MDSSPSCSFFAGFALSPASPSFRDPSPSASGVRAPEKLWWARLSHPFQSETRLHEGGGGEKVLFQWGRVVKIKCVQRSHKDPAWGVCFSSCLVFGLAVWPWAWPSTSLNPGVP